MSNLPVEPPNSNTYEIWTEKFKTLKASYQERLNELGKRFKTICLNISSDAIINQLRSDHTTVEFVKDRMAEIVQECMHDEKESVIAALQSECAEYRSEIFTIRSNYDNMIERLKSYDTETAKIKVEYEKELKSTQVAYQVRESELQQILGIKEKDIQELDHRLKISKDSIVEYESTLRKSKNELDECRGVIQEYKKNADVLNETISTLELDKSKYMHENEQLQKDLEKTLDERDVLRDKLNDAADKFEHTFTKQEDAYESQYKDMKEKHRKLKAKMVEDRAKFEFKLNEERKLFEEKISDDMAKHEVKLNNEKKKCEDEIARTKSESTSQMNQSNLEMQNLKNKYESNLSSKSQELIYEYTTRIKQLEMKQSEQKDKIDYYQNTLKNDQIHNENHIYILQRDLQDKEYKLREKQESVIKLKEDKLNEAIVNLKSKIEGDAVTYNNQNQDFKLELESKNQQYKETIAKYERQFEEEVEKRQKLSENLNEHIEKCRILTEEKHSFETKLINETNELNNLQKENSRLAIQINNLNNSEISLNKSLDLFKSQLNDAKLGNDKNILLIASLKEQIADLNLKLEDSNGRITDQKTLNNDYKQKLDNLSELLEQEKNKVFVANVNNKKEYVTLREEFTGKVENESRAHRDTVFKLHQSELEVKALESKLYGSLEKLQHAKNEITNLINENKEQKEKEFQIEEHNKELKSEISKNINYYNNKINKLKNKSVTFMTNAIKKIQLLKNEIYSLKNECNQDKVRIESNTLIQNINNRIFKVFKDLKYANLKECKQLRELCNNECLVNVQEKCTYQEALMDGHSKDQENKLKIKDVTIQDLNTECKELQKQVQMCSSQDNQIKNLQLKETQLLSDLNAQTEKLTLLKELTENEQEKHKETVNQMKKDFVDHVKERENQLYKEFEQILDTVETKFASKFKTLLESNANFSEYAADLQCDLDNISIETFKQAEQLQSHHNDQLVYNNSVIHMLKKEIEELKISLDETEQKQSKILNQFEEKFIDMSKKSNYEMDFFNKQKQDKALDRENLERTLREQKSHLHTSEMKIQSITREKDQITSSIKNDDNKLINEKLQMDSVIRAKDREIQELHTLLEKNYISGAETLKSVNKLRSSHLDNSVSFNLDVQNNQSLQSQGHMSNNNKPSGQGNQMLKSTQRN